MVSVFDFIQIVYREMDHIRKDIEVSSSTETSRKTLK
jgi:hypothetical protein